MKSYGNMQIVSIIGKTNQTIKFKKDSQKIDCPFYIALNTALKRFNIICLACRRLNRRLSVDGTTIKNGGKERKLYGISEGNFGRGAL